MKYWVEFRWSYGALQPWTVMALTNYVYCGPARPEDGPVNDGWIVDFAPSFKPWQEGNLIRIVRQRGNHSKIFLCAAWVYEVTAPQGKTPGREWRLLYANKPGQYSPRIKRL